jgi:hypothetical protein
MLTKKQKQNRRYYKNKKLKEQMVLESRSLPLETRQAFDNALKNDNDIIEEEAERKYWIECLITLILCFIIWNGGWLLFLRGCFF